MHYPLSPFTRTTYMEDQSFFHSNHFSFGLDFPIITSYFPVPFLGFPIPPLPILMLQALCSKEEPLLVLCIYPRFIYSQKTQTQHKILTNKMRNSHHISIHTII
ncbi:hypothetical protein ACB098_12G024900 [Castanea mollissima]